MNKIPFFPIEGGAFQPVPDTAQATAHFTGPDGVTPSFSLYSRLSPGAWDEANMDLLADAFGDSIEADYVPLLSTAFSFVGVTVRDLEVQFGRVKDYARGPTAGTVASPALPMNVAVRATFIGDPGAAPRRGAMNLLPPTESQAVGSKIEAGSLAAFQAAAENLHDSMSSLGGAAHVIVSRYLGTSLVEQPNGEVIRKPTKRATAVTNTIGSVLVDSFLDSQRKRLPRRP